MKRFLVSTVALAMAASTALSSNVWADASQSKYFIDMNSQSYGFWAVDEVDALFVSGVVKGVGDNRFAPDTLMEKGDFVLMLENSFHYPAIQVNKYNFVDVSQDDYYFTAINNARGNGIIEDSPLFYPQNPIKRLEAFNMLYNTMYLYGCVGNSGTTDVSMYTDGNTLSKVSDKIAVGTLTSLGIISGYNGEIKPYDTVTRAEMAVMLSKAIEVYEANGSNAANTGTVEVKKDDIETDTDTDSSETTDNAKITETYIVSDGETAEIDGNEIAVTSGDGVVAQGGDTSLTISGSKASTASVGSKIISVEDGAQAQLSDMDINISAKEAVGINIDEDSSATLESSKVFARYEDDSAVVNEGTFEATDSTFTAAKSHAITLYGGSKTDLVSTDVTAEGKYSAIYVKNNDDYDTAVINLSDVNLKGDSSAAAILVENAKVVINLKNVVLDGFKNFIDTSYNYSKGIKDTDIELNLDSQTFEGEISGDDMTNITLNLENGSKFIGVINYSDAAKSVTLKLSSDSTLELTDDCYVDVIDIDDEDMRRDRNFADIIDDNGHNIYYDASNHDNDYLNDDSYALQNGGTLIPVNVD